MSWIARHQPCSSAHKPPLCAPNWYCVSMCAHTAWNVALVFLGQSCPLAFAHVFFAHSFVPNLFLYLFLYLYLYLLLRRLYLTASACKYSCRPVSSDLPLFNCLVELGPSCESVNHAGYGCVAATYRFLSQPLCSQALVCACDYKTSVQCARKLIKFLFFRS